MVQEFGPASNWLDWIDPSELCLKNDIHKRQTDSHGNSLWVVAYTACNCNSFVWGKAVSTRVQVRNPPSKVAKAVHCRPGYDGGDEYTNRPP